MKKTVWLSLQLLFMMSSVAVFMDSNIVAGSIPKIKVLQGLKTFIKGGGLFEFILSPLPFGFYKWTEYQIKNNKREKSSNLNKLAKNLSLFILTLPFIKACFVVYYNQITINENDFVKNFKKNSVFDFILVNKSNIFLKRLMQKPDKDIAKLLFANKNNASCLFCEIYRKNPSRAARILKQIKTVENNSITKTESILRDIDAKKAAIMLREISTTDKNGLIKAASILRDTDPEKSAIILREMHMLDNGFAAARIIRKMSNTNDGAGVASYIFLEMEGIQLGEIVTKYIMTNMINIDGGYEAIKRIYSEENKMFTSFFQEDLTNVTMFNRLLEEKLTYLEEFKKVVMINKVFIRILKARENLKNGEDPKEVVARILKEIINFKDSKSAIEAAERVLKIIENLKNAKDDKEKEEVALRMLKEIINFKDGKV